MIKSLFCWLWGHKYWEWIVVEITKTGYSDTRVQYNRCLRCDKRRDDIHGSNDG